MESQFQHDLKSPPDQASSGTSFPPTSPWLAPEATPAYGFPPSSGAPIYDLRPLTTSEILDRTFSVYRSRFWLFAGIAAISGAVQVLSSGAQMMTQHFIFHGVQLGRFSFTSTIISLIASLLFLLAYCVTMAATTFAVGEIYLGRNTTVKEAWKATVGRWLAYIGIALWQFGSAIYVPMLMVIPGVILLTRLPGAGPAGKIAGGFLVFVGILGGSIVGIILLIRNLLAIPAAVIEKMKVRASFQRSKFLAIDAKGRIFLVCLISYCLFFVVGMLEVPLAIVTLMALKKGHESIGAQAGTLVIGFLGHSVVTPVAMIGLTLIYFDQRVRKEAFDLAMMLGEDQPLAPTAPLSALEVPAAPSQYTDHSANDASL